MASPAAELANLKMPRRTGAVSAPAAPPVLSMPAGGVESKMPDRDEAGAVRPGQT
jgi:hypothetical protein